MFATLRNRFEISPQRYAQVTTVALIGLALIVLTGAAVRLTDSGLGCPDWPQCYGAGAHPALESHAIIESANRIITGLLGLAVIAAARARLLPPPLPSPPGHLRRPAAARRDRAGDPRRPGGQVRPAAGTRDVPLHPLDDAARRGLRALLVLPLRALGPAPLLGPQGRLGGAGAGPAGTADDPRRDRRHRVGTARGRVRRPVRPALHLRGRRHDARMGGPAPRGAGDDLRVRRDRRLVLPAPPRRRPAGAQTAHRRPPAARRAGRRRLPPVGARTADRDRLGPRRARHLQLAGDAVDDRRRRAGSSRATDVPASRVDGTGSADSAATAGAGAGAA